MGRPKAKELTERELEIMHIFWDDGELSAVDVRERLAEQGKDLAYTTVATLVRILLEKEFLTQINDQRPFRYKPAKSFEDVSGRILGDLVQRVFQGSREQLLVRLLGQKKLTAKEREAVERLLRNKNQPPLD